MAISNQTFPWDVKEKVFECIKITEFKNPVPWKNTHVCEFVRKSFPNIKKNEDWSVADFGEPKMALIKQYCTLEKGTRPDQVKYCEASYISVENDQKQSKTA